MRGGAVSKTCKKCGETKDVSLYTRDKKKTGGYRHECIECRKAYKNKWMRLNPGKNKEYCKRHDKLCRERYPERYIKKPVVRKPKVIRHMDIPGFIIFNQSDYRFCSVCKVSKSWDVFVNAYGKSISKSAECKPCNSERQIRNAKANGYEHRKKWEKNNPEKHLAGVHRRRTRRRERKNGCFDFFAGDDRQQVMDRFNNKCFNCDTTDMLRIDHHHPLFYGNSLSHQNAVVLCDSCNASKAIKHPKDFYTRKQIEVLCAKGIVTKRRKTV